VHELTHASFFSGVGGLDLGLERAGWRTVSFSEIDPYASAVLAERWPGVPNLGDIVALAVAEPAGRTADERGGGPTDSGRRQAGSGLPRDCATATLWSGGFPCQDLSVAGKRRGFSHTPQSAESGRNEGRVTGGIPAVDDRTRSGLAFAFLDLVDRYRPPAILLENVPGLLSSNAGRDFGTLLGRLAELGYWWAYRILDAQYFGVPQRRRRVFILALHAGAGFGADSAAAVLSVGARCDGHSAAGDEAGAGVTEGATRRVAPAVRAGGHGDPGIGRDNDEDRLIFNATAKFGEFVEDDIAGNLSARDYKSSNHLIGAPPDSGGVRAADGLAGRLDDSPQLATALRASGNGNDLSAGDDGRLIAATLNSGGNDGGFRTELGEHLVTGSAPVGPRIHADVDRGGAGGRDVGGVGNVRPLPEGAERPVAFTKRARVSGPDTPESWAEGGVMPTLNSFDVGDTRTTAAIVQPIRTNPYNNSDPGMEAGMHHFSGPPSADDPLLPLGLDSHRYRCCGNGVVSNVAEWVGVRLTRAFTEGASEAMA
jgi:DNA (cytosine-5)-methyltransferase 1